MKLEDEKKLVAKWMGWKIRPALNNNLYPLFLEMGEKTRGLNYALWNPQSERKWWDEIWENMDANFKTDYLQEICFILSLPIPPSFSDIGIAKIFLEHFMEIHTTKPEINWKSLIRTLRKLKINE